MSENSAPKRRISWQKASFPITPKFNSLFTVGPNKNIIKFLFTLNLAKSVALVWPNKNLVMFSHFDEKLVGSYGQTNI